MGCSRGCFCNTAVVHAVPVCIAVLVLVAVCLFIVGVSVVHSVCIICQWAVMVMQMGFLLLMSSSLSPPLLPSSSALLLTAPSK